MITELDVYKVCHGTYEDEYAWDKVFQGKEDAQTFVGIKEIEGISIVAFRGSTTPLDWVRNFIALPDYVHGEGWVDLGFEIGVEEAFDNIAPLLKGKPWLLTGHSRGAAQALLFGAYTSIHGIEPKGILALAPPRTGRSGLREILASVPIRAYKNKGDPVPEVPSWFDEPCEMIKIDVPAPIGDPWGPVARHHSELYGKWISILSPQYSW